MAADGGTMGRAGRKNSLVPVSDSILRPNGGEIMSNLAIVGDRKLRTIAVLSTVFLLTACASTGNLVESPSVRLSNVQTGHMSFDSQNFLLGFEISNPNGFPLPVKAVQYNVRINDQRFASGETQGAFTVPADGASSFTISVELDILQQTSRLASLLRVGSQGEVPYELEGSLAVNIPFTKPVKFSNKGTVSLAGGF